MLATKCSSPSAASCAFWPRAGRSGIREALSGNTCRSTGYQWTVDAVCEPDRAWTR